MRKVSAGLDSWQAWPPLLCLLKQSQARCSKVVDTEGLVVAEDDVAGLQVSELCGRHNDPRSYRVTGKPCCSTPMT